MKKLLKASLLGLVLISACTSTGLKEPFAQTDPMGIVLGGDKFSYWTLERIDLNSKIATGEYVLIAGPSWSDTHRLVAEGGGIAYGLEKIEPGLYAFESGSSSSWNGVGTVTSEMCFDSAAPVYKIEAGKLSIIPNFPNVSEASNQVQVEQVLEILKSHPDISAEPVTPEQVAIIDYGRPTRKEKCKFNKNEKPITIVSQN